MQHLNQEMLTIQEDSKRREQETKKMQQQAESQLEEAEDLVHKNAKETEAIIREAIEQCRQRNKELLKFRREVDMSMQEVEVYRNVAEQRRKELEGYIKDAERYRLQAEKQRWCRQEVEQRAYDLEKRLVDVDSGKPWIVHRQEIFMTNKKLGQGGFGEVWLAYFRGTQVAPKVHYNSLHSEYFDGNFIREMNMASRVRHPNLVQFIGGSMDQEMVLLLEYMPTSLRHHLEKYAPIIPSIQFCHSVSLDVVKALNYLHLMQPDPIIHRDISSTNVLLEPVSNRMWRAKVTDYGSVNLQKQAVTNNPGNPHILCS